MKETRETVETTGDTCKYKSAYGSDQRDCGSYHWRNMQIQNCVERPKQTKETVETVEMRDTCKYKLYGETERDQRRLKRLQRREIHASTKLYGETERD